MFTAGLIMWSICDLPNLAKLHVMIVCDTPRSALISWIIKASLPPPLLFLPFTLPFFFSSRFVTCEVLSHIPD